MDRHILVCTDRQCSDAGAEEVYRYLKKRVKEVPELKGVWVNRSGSVGGCEHGPVVVIYPEGIWYHSMTKARVDEMIQRHLLGGEILDEWLFHCTEGCAHVARPGEAVEEFDEI